VSNDIATLVNKGKACCTERKETTGKAKAASELPGKQGERELLLVTRGSAFPASFLSEGHRSETSSLPSNSIPLATYLM
jgi:hypothetical protein